MQARVVTEISTGVVKIWVVEAGFILAVESQNPEALRLSTEMALQGPALDMQEMRERYLFAHWVEVPNDLLSYAIRRWRAQFKELQEIRGLFKEMMLSPTDDPGMLNKYLTRFEQSTQPVNDADRQEEHRMASRVQELMRAPPTKPSEKH